MKRIVCKLGEIQFNYNKISNGKVLYFIFTGCQTLWEYVEGWKKTCKPKRNVIRYIFT